MELIQENLKRTRSKDTTLYEVSNRGSRIIRLPFDRSSYKEMIMDAVCFRSYVDEFVALFPELFPIGMSRYELHDIRYSKRCKLSYRRIIIGKINYTIQPSFVTPYWTADCEDVWYPLLLLHHGVPYWLITLGFGHQDDFWYRLFCHLGRFNIVGTTARKSGVVPEDLAADEKISWWQGQEIYICTTAAQECLWGAEPSPSEDTSGLSQGYGVFVEQARQVQADYQAKSVNCDGWPATRKAWQSLCANVIVILCFLHGYLKIRESAKKLACRKELYNLVWEAYQEDTKEGFLLKINELQNWATNTIQHEPTLRNVQKLCDKAQQYSLAYDQPQAYPTSNTVDRPMRRLDRFLFINQYFHGHFASAQLLCRAFALSYNFIPFCPRAALNHTHKYQSRAARYNNFAYHENWLVNLLTAASLNGNIDNPQLP